MIVQPNPRDFGLSQEALERVERQIVQDMPFREACTCVGGLLVSLVFGIAVEDTALRCLLGISGIFFGFQALKFCWQKALRLIRKSLISSDWANHARYRWALRSYLDAVASVERERQKQQAREREARLAQQRREYEANRRKVDWWRSLGGTEFETELAQFLEEHGYAVRRTGGSGDGGVDLYLQKSGETILVQCKAHQGNIGPGAIRDLYGTLKHHRADEAWLIASRGFTSGARRFASGKSVRLLSIENLLELADTLL